MGGAERPVIMITGDPEVGRLKWQGRLPADVMTSEREAVIGAEHFEAAEGKSTKTFHARMCQTARERGKFIVSLGFEPPPPPKLYPAPVATEKVH